MLQEFLDVVDRNDQVIDKRLRSDIHRLGLRHRAVHILVGNQQNQYFLQKRSILKDINPGLWDTSAAGHVDSGEDYDSCAVRELQEELGITLNHTPDLLFKIDACPATGMEFIHVYRLSYDGPFTLCPEEIETGAWFDKNCLTAKTNADDPELTESFKKIWQCYTA